MKAEKERELRKLRQVFRAAKAWSAAFHAPMTSASIFNLYEAEDLLDRAVSRASKKQQPKGSNR